MQRQALKLPTTSEICSVAAETACLTVFLHSNSVIIINNESKQFRRSIIITTTGAADALGRRRRISLSTSEDYSSA